MIVKPSIAFLNNDTDAQLILDVPNILTAVATNHAIYAAPNPPLASITAALTTFENAVAAQLAGSTPALTLAKNNARAALAALMRNLANYVQSACGGSLENLVLSGFPTQKPTRSPIGQLPAPGGLTVVLGFQTGELDAQVAPLPGAAIYNWQVVAANAPSVIVQSAQTTAASNTFTGLTPGVIYAVTANAVGSAGPSDWSDPVSQMVV